MDDTTLDTPETPADTGTFFETLTMAEIANMETITGHSLGDSESSAEATTALGVLAALRLGTSITLAEARSLSITQIQTLIDAAASQPAPDYTPPSENLASLLRDLSASGK